MRRSLARLRALLTRALLTRAGCDQRETSIPFELDLAPDERVGVAFGLRGSAIRCGETVISRIAVTPEAD